MTNDIAALTRTSGCAVVREQIFTVARQHSGWSRSELRDELLRLRRQAEREGLHIIAGLTQAFEDELATCRCQQCPSVYLHYMTRALALEPSNDHDILDLLLSGINRRLAEARH